MSIGKYLPFASKEEELMTEAYYGMKGLIEPEGWPPARVYNRSRIGTKCSQLSNDRERRKRLDVYRKLAEKEMPLTKEKN